MQSVWKRYGFVWVALGFFILSFLGHWIFGWFAHVDEQQAHGQAISLGGYAVEMARDTFENWQSEFLQLLWQVGGLAALLYAGPPQSKEEGDRMEAKIDALLRVLAHEQAERIIRRLDEIYEGRDADATGIVREQVT